MAVRRTIVVLLALGIGVLLGRLIAGVGDAGDAPGQRSHVTTATGIVVLQDVPGLADEQSGWLLGAVDPTLQLQVTPTTPTPLVVGVAPADEIEQWLAGAAHDHAEELDDDGRLSTISLGGERRLPSGPEPDWLDQVEGTTEVNVRWTPESGRVAAVIATRDPAAIIDADVHFHVGMHLGLAVLVVGLLVLLVVVILVVATAASARRANRDPLLPTD